MMLGATRVQHGLICQLQPQSWIKGSHVLNGRTSLQGHNARPANIALVIEAFKDGLQKQGKL